MDKHDRQNPTEPALISVDEVCALLGTSRVSVLRAVRRKGSTFPAPVVLFAEQGQGGGRGRCHRWKKQEVLDYIERLPRSTDLGPSK